MTIDEQCTVGDRQLRLNGIGLRKVMMFNVYRAYLYTAEKVSSTEALYALAEPKRILFEYLYGPISKERIASAWLKALKKGAGAEDIASPIDRFVATMGEYQKGDIVHYDISTSNELSVYNNGQQCDVIASQPLCMAVLDVIFGSEPIDQGLKDGLLGNPH